MDNIQALRKQLIETLRQLKDADPSMGYEHQFNLELDAYNECYEEQLPE